MTDFNATASISQTTPDFLRRTVIEDYILAPLATYRVTYPSSFIQCSDPSCIGVRIHDNFQYTIAVPANWTANDPIPEPSPTWLATFDPDHQWDSFRVADAMTMQLEFWNVDVAPSFRDDECQLYGYPFLAIQICFKGGSAQNNMILCTSTNPDKSNDNSSINM